MLINKLDQGEYFELAEIASIYSGGTPPKGEPSYWNGSLPWLSAKDLKTFRVSDSIDRVSESAVGRGTRAVNAGATLVLVRGMQLFKSIPVALTMRRVTFNQDVKAVVAGEKVDPTFLAYALVARASELSMGVSAAGHGTGRLATETLETLPIWLPALPEQRRIAAVLDAWDSAIGIAERLIKAKHARFDWIRDQVLTGRRRLHGFNDVWHAVRLADVVHEHGLCATGDEEVFSVSVHKGLVNQIEHLGRSFSAADTSHYNRVLPGDIVYTKSPTGEFPLGIIKQSKIEQQVIVSPLYGVFTPRSLDLGMFLDAYFTSPKATEKYLAPLVQKGAKNTIAVTNAQFLQGALTIPGDDQEMEALAQLVASAIAEIAAAEAELERLRQQKRGLTQQLLTGKLPVPESIDALLPPAPELVAAA